MPYPGRRRRRSGGLLTTAGGLLFGGDAGGNFVARDAKTGKPLWHARIGRHSNAPQTYAVDGRQHVLVAVNDTLYAFALDRVREDSGNQRQSTGRRGGKEELSLKKVPPFLPTSLFSCVFGARCFPSSLPPIATSTGRRA